MKRTTAGISNLRAVVDVAKTYRWPAVWLAAAASMLAQVRMVRR